MHSIRRRAYAAAYKTPNDQNAFNPFAARRPIPRRDEETPAELNYEATGQDLEDPSIRTHDDGIVLPISDAMVQEEVALERAHTLETEAADGPDPYVSRIHDSLQNDSEDSIAPRRSRHSGAPLQRPQSVASKRSSSEGSSTEDLFQIPLSGPSKAQVVTTDHGKPFPAPESQAVKIQEPEKAEIDDTPIDDSTVFEVVLKTLTGKSLLLKVSRNTTTEELQAVIQDKEGIPPDQQRIICRGQQIELKRTLKDYNVRPGMNLHLVLRLRGGGNGGRYGVDGPHLNFVRFNRDGTTTKLPPPKRKTAITFGNQMRLIFFNSYAHLLIFFIPAGFALYYCHVNQIVVFTINFIAIIPSAMELGFAVDDFSLRVGETFEGLISMTFRSSHQPPLHPKYQTNTPQQRRPSNHLNLPPKTTPNPRPPNLPNRHHPLPPPPNDRPLLLPRRPPPPRKLLQRNHRPTPRLPPPPRRNLPHHPHNLPPLLQHPPSGILRQSHATAILLLLSYAAWLLFQLRTHPDLFREPPPPPRPFNNQPGTAFRALGAVGARTAGTVGGALIQNNFLDEDDEADEPQLSIPIALTTIVLSTVLIAFNTQFATESINGLLDQAGLTPTFVGLVILPLLGNDPTTLVVAYKDKMDLSLELTMGKCMQTALMVVPLVVVIGWGMGVEGMTLLFDGFEVASLFAAILIVCYIVQDGRSTWIQGALLVEAYVIVAIAAYFVP